VQRADLGIRSQGRVRDPQLRAPGDIVSGQAPAGCLLGDARLRQRQAGVRAGQDLGRRQGAAFLTQSQASQRGQIPAGTVTRDDKGAISPGQLRLVTKGPPDGAGDILDGCWPRVLGSPLEVHGEHGHPCAPSVFGYDPFKQADQARRPGREFTPVLDANKGLQGADNAAVSLALGSSQRVR